MLKTILIAIVAVLVFNALFVFSGGLELLVQTNQETTPEAQIAPDVVDVFQFTLEDEVRKKLGQPIEGFEPYMYLQVFPGLVETDFNGVEASVGQYVIVKGKLEHQLDSTKLVHSAAKIIGREGMATLLENVSQRININLTTDGTITDVVRALVSQG